MEIRAKIRFRDIEKDTIREIGATWKTSEDRAKYLIGLGYAEAIEEEKPVKEKPAKAAPKPKTTKKK